MGWVEAVGFLALLAVFAAALRWVVSWSPAWWSRAERALRYPLGSSLLGPAFWALAGVAALGWFEGAGTAAALVALAFFGLGLYCIVDMRFRVELVEGGFRVRSPWKGEAVVTWAEVVGLRYSAWCRWFVVETRTTRHRMSESLVHFDEFMTEVQSSVDRTVWEHAVRASMPASRRVDAASDDR